ncbi:MAG: hypothetical protein ABFS12_03400 [Bacteroidota bacterium]
MTINKKLMAIFFMVIAMAFVSCSEEEVKPDPQQKAADSLTLEKENKALEVKELKGDVDSLEKHLDSLETVPVDSAK